MLSWKRVLYVLFFILVAGFAALAGGLGLDERTSGGKGARTDRNLSIRRTSNMPDNKIFKDRPDSDARTSAVTIQKWGGFASFLMAVTFIIPAWIYLTGNLRDVMGPFAYALADFLYGPVWAASLVTAVYALLNRKSKETW